MISSSEKIAVLDGLRGVAILLVVCVHVGSTTGVFGREELGWRVLGTGEIGVPIFFALSGFLLYRPFARATLNGTGPPGIRSYLRRRAFRILPAYWLMLPAGLALAGNPQAARPLIWLEFATLTHPYDPGRWWEGTSLISIWSLSVEASFYLLLPALAWLLHRTCGGSARRMLAVTCGLALASVVWAVSLRYCADLQVVFYNEHLLPRSLVHFMLGMALAVVAERPGPAAARVAASPGVSWMVGTCGLVLLSTPLSTPLSGPQSAHQYLIDALVAPVVAMAVVAPVALDPNRPFNRVLLGNRAVSGLGRISYGVFLWHVPVLIAWYRLTERPVLLGDFRLVLSVVLPISIVFGILSHDLVELPLQRLGRRTEPVSRRPPLNSAEKPGKADRGSGQVQV